MNDEIVGRERELEAVQRFLDAARDGPRALVLEGEAGIGKTTVWRAGVGTARRKMYWVLSCRPAEAEAKLGFAALGDLLEPVLDETLPQLPAPQRRALEVALLRAPAEGRPPDARAVALGVLGVLRALAGLAPVVIAIDDVQWLDSASSCTLTFVLRRLEREHVALLAARRRGGATEPVLVEQTERLSIGPLDVNALAAVIRARLGPALLRPTLVRIHDASGGNPFFALEIARALARTGARPVPGEPLPVPENLGELLRERVARLPPRTRAALLAAAALSEPTVSLVGTASLTKAVDAEIVELDGERIRFTHPLLASAVYGSASPEQRRRIHRALAARLDDPEEHARHLALSAAGADAGIAAALDAAGARASARGAPVAAAELAEHAAALTPPGDPGAHAERALRAAAYHFEAGDTRRARTSLEELVAALEPGTLRAHALYRLAFVREWEHGGSDEGPRLMKRALEETGDDRHLAAVILGQLAKLLSTQGKATQADPYCRAALELAEELGDPALLAQALVVAAFNRFQSGVGRDQALVERALELWGSGRADAVFGSSRLFTGNPGWRVAHMELALGEVDAARARIEALRAAAIELGGISTLPLAVARLSVVEWAAGNWELAHAYALEALEHAHQTGMEAARSLALAAETVIEAHRGRVDIVRERAAEGLAIGDASEILAFRCVLGFLELSLGNAADARSELEPIVAELEALGIREPCLPLPFRPDLVEALVALGELARAREVLDELERRARALDHPWATPTASRCRALVLAAQGDAERALASAEQALREHERLPVPFELGRTLLVKGTIERRAKQRRAARESLGQALEIFDGLGAALWAKRARAELARISGRATESGLTPTEHQIAALVAEGRTNREVSETLFVSVKTVEANLSRIYRKLGISSRRELSRRGSRVQT